MMHLLCVKCHQGDDTKKGKVLIYPSGNYHEGCKHES